MSQIEHDQQFSNVLGRDDSFVYVWNKRTKMTVIVPKYKVLKDRDSFEPISKKEFDDFAKKIEEEQETFKKSASKKSIVKEMDVRDFKPVSPTGTVAKVQ